MPNRQQLTNKQMFNLNFGFLGIQFAWALQFATISGVFKFLGADDDQIPILWLAGPITGLIVPPIIGILSDHTWVGFLGKRRVYILLGAIFATFALIAIPNTRDLTHAVLLVWLLDAGLNMAMHPYRALIADRTPPNQQTKCFSCLTIASCIGSAFAFILPWCLAIYINIIGKVNNHSIPLSIEYAFIIGAVVLFLSNLATILNTREYKIDRLKENARNLGRFADYFSIPKVMQDLIKVEFFVWIGLFSFIIYYALGISQNIYGLPEGESISVSAHYSELLQKGVELCGLFSFIYIIVSTLFAMVLPRLSLYIDRKKIYSMCLFMGSLGLVTTSLAYSKAQLFIGVLCIGLAWGAAVTIPFAILSAGVPQEKTGWYMGYYNLFVVIPQMIVSCSFGYIIRVFFNDHAMSVILLGGLSLFIASLFALRIRDPFQTAIEKNTEQDQQYSQLIKSC